MAHGFLKFLKSAVLGLAALASTAQAGESIVLASTTSTEQSGLFNFILPIFEKDSGIAVKVVAWPDSVTTTTAMMKRPMFSTWFATARRRRWVRGDRGRVSSRGPMLPSRPMSAVSDCCATPIMW